MMKWRIWNPTASVESRQHRRLSSRRPGFESPNGHEEEKMKTSRKRCHRRTTGRIVTKLGMELEETMDYLHVTGIFILCSRYGTMDVTVERLLIHIWKWRMSRLQRDRMQRGSQRRHIRPPDDVYESEDEEMAS